MEVGVRVVRGPDWDLEDAESDGGEGFVGTIVEVGSKSSILPENLVWVLWDSGIRHDHRAGYHKGYDLYMLDCSAIGRLSIALLFAKIRGFNLQRNVVGCEKFGGKGYSIIYFNCPVMFCLRGDL